MILHHVRPNILILALAGAIMLATPSHAEPDKDHPSFKPIESKPGQPQVLLIGDSISMGYTLPVRALLNGKANVHRPPANCQSTTEALDNLDSWLQGQKWDVIHFNWGLHDLKYMNRYRKLVDIGQGTQQNPIDKYEIQLRQLVKNLKATGAVLIWCSTTPVPEGAKGRAHGDDVKFNDVARKIMQDEGVAINDLHAFAMERLAKIQKEANVHFTDEGSAVLAEEVARWISMAIDGTLPELQKPAEPQS